MMFLRVRVVNYVHFFPMIVYLSHYLILMKDNLFSTQWFKVIPLIRIRIKFRNGTSPCVLAFISTFQHSFFALIVIT